LINERVNGQEPPPKASSKHGSRGVKKTAVWWGLYQVDETYKVCSATQGSFNRSTSIMSALSQSKVK